MLDALGPFEPAPRVAVAVSGGPDSLALTLLTDAWARARGGACQGLIVDHGLRSASATEAALTRDRLDRRGIPATILSLGLRPGARQAERARDARHAALARACAERGILHLLMGHHAADQAETVAMRRLRGSGPDGLAGMAALVETSCVRLLRPLLAVPPGRLRALLAAERLDWIDDPSNRDPASLRASLRAASADPDGTGPAIAAAIADAARLGEARAARERSTADWLARHARLHPEGFAIVAARAAIPLPALAALLRVVAGAARPPPARQVEAWLRDPRPSTLGGVSIGRLPRLAPDGWLLVREAAAMGPPVAARLGLVWDGRFRLSAAPSAGDGMMLGALGEAAATRRSASVLPSSVLRTLPALWRDGRLIAVPHLDSPAAPSVLWCPARPAAGPAHAWTRPCGGVKQEA